MAARPPRDDESVDVVFRGRLTLLQSKKGYRTSVDTMLAAWWAATIWRRLRGPATPEHVLDLGAGTGLIGVALGRTFPGAAITMLERQATLAERAIQNALRNGIAARTDVLRHDLRHGAPASLAGRVTLVATNPPFHLPAGRVPPRHEERRVAHLVDGADVDAFVDAAAGLLRPGGMLAAVFPWTRRAALLDAMATQIWHDVRVQPVRHRENGAEPVRVLVSGVRASGRPAPGSDTPPPVLAAPLALHGAREDDARYHEAIEAVRAGLGPRC